MLHDPADETHRKPRQLRNTPMLKYVRLTSLFITLCYAGALYISWRRHSNDPEVLKEYQTNQYSEDERSMLEDYASIPFLRGTIEKLVERQQARSKAEAESKDTQVKQQV